MDEGFYWIQFNGMVQIGLFLSGASWLTNSDDKQEDYWLIDGGHEIDHDENVKVIFGPLDINV